MNCYASLDRADYTPFSKEKPHTEAMDIYRHAFVLNVDIATVVIPV